MALPVARLTACGGEFSAGKEGTSPQIHKDSRRKGGNLRNGSNAGASYLNCRNRLGNAGWNYLSRNYTIIFCVVFRS